MNIAGKLRNLRRKQGITLDKLSAATGLSKGYLSRIETGKQLPTISKLQEIASILGSDISELMEAAEKQQTVPGLEIKRSGLHRGEVLDAEGYKSLPLLGNYRNKYMAPFLMILDGNQENSGLTHDSEEFVYVMKGRIQLSYNDGTYELEEGDSAYLDSRGKHGFRNLNEKEQALLLTINFNYRRF